MYIVYNNHIFAFCSNRFFFNFILQGDPRHFYYYSYSIFCGYFNFLPDQIAVIKYEINNIVYNPEVSYESDKYIFKYSVKSLKLKESGDEWPFSIYDL